MLRLVLGRYKEGAQYTVTIRQHEDQFQVLILPFNWPCDHAQVNINICFPQKTSILSTIHPFIMSQMLHGMMDKLTVEKVPSIV